MILSKFSETISETKVKPMPIQIDIRKAPFYKWGKQEGLKEGILGIIQAKFGSQKAKQINSLLLKFQRFCSFK
jgi:hypothetical protein